MPAGRWAPELDLAREPFGVGGGRAVAAVLQDYVCPACGGRHVLCDLDAEPPLRERYAYTCPAAECQVIFLPGGAGEAAPGCPPGALPMKPRPSVSFIGQERALRGG